MFKILRTVYNFLKGFQGKTLGVRAIVVKDGAVLLVKHTYTQHWYLPGGGVEKHEAPLAALTRELKEEVGVSFTEPPKLLGVYHSLREKKDDYTLVYTVLPTGQETVVSPEIRKAECFLLSDLPHDLSPATRRRIEEYVAGEAVGDLW